MPAARRAGCASGSSVRYATGSQTSGQIPSALQRKVRALAMQDHVLLCGDTAGGMQAWDMSTNPPQGRALTAHTAGVRAIDVEQLTNTVYTAADDRCSRYGVKRAWCEDTLIWARARLV